MGKAPAKRRQADNEALAVGRMIRSSPRKLNLVASSIRGLDCARALTDLTFSKKAVAGDVRKVLETAVANAENNHELDVDRLYVAEASVGKGMVMKRFRARARGGVGRIDKPFSNLRIVVREREEAA